MIKVDNVQLSCLCLFDFSVSGPLTIEGIFGKDWCMDLWKDRDPYSVEGVTDSVQSSDKVRGRHFISVLV